MIYEPGPVWLVWKLPNLGPTQFQVRPIFDFDLTVNPQKWIMPGLIGSEPGQLSGQSCPFATLELECLMDFKISNIVNCLVT